MDGATTDYVDCHFEERGSTMTRYYYAGGQQVAMRQGGVLTYLHGDHLGSASLATNASGAKVSEQRYLPYGGTRSGSMPTDRQFTGQRHESSLGFYDFVARQFDPTLGRFLQADTIIPNPGNPQSLNRYSYTLGNPLRYTDPSGHFAWPPLPDAWGYRIEGTIAPLSLFGDLTALASILEPTPLTDPAAAALWLVSKISVDVNLDFVYIPEADKGDHFNVFLTVGSGGLTEGGSVSAGPLAFWGLKNSEQLTGLTAEAGGTLVWGAGGVEVALGYNPSLQKTEGDVMMLYLSPGTAVGTEISAYAQIGRCWSITDRLLHTLNEEGLNDRQLQ